MGPIWITSLFLRHYAGPIQNRMWGQSTSPIPEHILVLKAPRGDDPQVQSGTLSLFFQTPCRDDPRVKSGTMPLFKAQWFKTLTTFSSIIGIFCNKNLEKFQHDGLGIVISLKQTHTETQCIIIGWSELGITILHFFS